MARKRNNQTTKTRLTLTNGDTVYVDSGDMTVAYDSGQVSAFRPAQHTKPGLQGFMKRVLSQFTKENQRPPAEKTTEQGSSGAASPSTYELSLYSQRYERREIISDCQAMFHDDPRARKSIQMYAREAVRGGASIVVSGTSGKGRKSTFARRAQEIADEIQGIVNKSCVSWAEQELVEGEIFIQVIVDSRTKKVVDAKRMPATSMERLTDDTDSFIDNFKAFAQLDVVTNEETATFPLWMIHHERWNHVDGERYGMPEAVAGRRARRLLELVEEAQAVRRMTRASQRVLWNVGTAEKPGAPEAVEEFKENNGFVEGTREMFDTTEIARDYFANGLVTQTVIGGDGGVGDIGDIEYMQNVFTSSALPTPGPLFNLDAGGVNRDILDDIRGEWLKQTRTLSDSIKNVVRWLMDLALLLDDIPPETVEYGIHFSESTIERPSEIVDRVIKLMGNELGGSPYPLISRKHGMQILADIIDIEDVDAEIEQIERELDFMHHKSTLQQVQQMRATSSVSGSEHGAAFAQQQQQAAALTPEQLYQQSGQTGAGSVAQQVVQGSQAALGGGQPTPPAEPFNTGQ